MLIGEVARRSGVSARMLRHYDSLGLVCPTGRTVGNYREYAAEDIRRIFHVESLRSLGLSLREIKQALEDPGFVPAVLVADLIARSEERLRRERELLERLRAVGSAGASDWRGVLRIVELLQGLDSPDAARRQQAVLAPGEEVPVPVEVLVGAVLAEADPNVAGALRWALARSGGGAVASVAAGLGAEDAAVRLRAVRALADLPGGEVAGVLADALGDVDAAVRGRAALALGARGSMAAVPVLVAMVVAGVNDVEASEVLGVLSADPVGAERIVGALVGELAGADVAVRIRLAQAFAELPGVGAREALVGLAGDGDRAVALVAGALVRMREDL